MHRARPVLKASMIIAVRRWQTFSVRTSSRLLASSILKLLRF